MFNEKDLLEFYAYKTVIGIDEEDNYDCDEEECENDEDDE